MSKSKSRRKVVKGPQLASRVLLGKSKGSERHPYAVAKRTRFVEPPAKKVGSPFFAVRVPAELHGAFLKHCKGRKLHPNDVIRGYMSRVTGVSAEASSDE